MLHALNVETPSPGNSVANSPILPLSIGRRSFSNHRRSHTEHTNPNLLSKNCFLNSASANLRFNRYRLLYSLLISLKFIASTDIYFSILLPSLPPFLFSAPRAHTRVSVASPRPHTHVSVASAEYEGYIIHVSIPDAMTSRFFSVAVARSHWDKRRLRHIHVNIKTCNCW